MNFRVFFICLFSFWLNFEMDAQVDSLLSRLSFEMDFRFRIEQDWNSRKANGSFRDDRTRLRYRFRTGVKYEKDWLTIGFRLRTGDQRKQQDPQLTLGKGWKEFGTLPIGFEKIYMRYRKHDWNIWVGKNGFPFDKNNELFWSDNVFPEGVFIGKKLNINKGIISKLALRAGHFVLSSNNTTFLDDAYFQGYQTSIAFGKGRFAIFPSFYMFRNIPNIPDGDHTFLLDYSIVHIGSKFQILRSKGLQLEFDYFQNLEDYDQESNIPSEFEKENLGIVMGVKYGSLRKKKNIMVKLSYAYMERFSNLDYMAQNDWARWEYSSNNSPDGRLSNFEGIELVIGYAISEKTNIVMKYYNMNQLVRYGSHKETGQRIRFDINTKI